MADIRISELLAQKQGPLLSYEFFPPKDERGFSLLRTAAEQLLPTHPDFVTCTYGAGGSTRERTLEVCEMLRDMGFHPVMPHLTCVGSSRSELEEIADEIYDQGFRNIMALRGDPPDGATSFIPRRDGLAYASELATLLKQRYPDLCCGVAGFPETHPEATSSQSDIAHLKHKLACGGDFITTQLFFENSTYFDYVQRCRAAGIEAPILPGLLPATSFKQSQRIVTTCKASFPAALGEALQGASENADAAAEIGIRWTADQVRDLLANGAPGVHLYILNKARTALAPTIKDCFGR